MCGIAGIFNFNTEQKVNEDILRRMTRVLSHRGPDDEGIYLSHKSYPYGHRQVTSHKSVGLGHRRLSIIDLSLQAHQPMSNEDGTIWIVFNGEIYNFLELRENLISKGHKFKSNTDSEVIAHLYEEKGEDLVTDLHGMFAFCIWDERKNKMVLARDRVGKKPLYYFIDDKRLMFASEIKSILQDKTVSREIDFEATDDFFTFQCISAPKTIFKKIKKLLPGHILICTPQKIEEREYWDLEFRDDGEKSESYYIQKLSQILHESVKQRLISDVPLGAFLSGGVDSSLVVALMSEILGNQVITSSIGFNDRKFNELEFSRIIAKKYKAVYHESIVEPKAIETIDKLIQYFDEPFADASAIPTYYVSQMTRKHVKVALSGDGGDESFAGYRRYYFDRLENRLRVIPEFLRRYLIGPMAKMYPKADWMPRFLRAKTLLTNLSLSSSRGYMNTRSTFKYSQKEGLYSQSFKERLKGYDPFNILDYYFRRAKTRDPLSRIQYVDIKTYLADDILTKVDRMSMANSLEVRSPLLDHKLLEFLAVMPSSLKLRGNKSKYILKKYAKSKLPKVILNRKKMGFGVPLESWFRNEIKNFTEEILFDSKSLKRGYFNPSHTKNIWNQHLSGVKNNSTQLWCLLIFELWHRSYIDNQ